MNIKSIFINTIKSTLCAFTIILPLLAVSLLLWAHNTWDNLNYEQIITNVNQNINIKSILHTIPEIKFYLYSALIAFILLLLILSNKQLLIACLLLCCVAIYQLGIIPHYYYINTTTDLYEQHYVAPQISATDFPEKKRNLLVLYLESIEQNFSSAELYAENLLPKLTELTKTNPHFKNYNLLYGTDYTKGAFIAGICGIPNRIGSNPTNSVRGDLGNITCLSDILAENGYETWFGKSASHIFAATNILYRNHNYKNIIDSYELTKNLSPEEIQQHASSYDGLDDKLLLTHIINLFNEQKIKEPFLLTAFTVDSHAPGTILPKNCPQKYNDIRDNILCTDNNVAQFLEDFKKTPYWENTTVVIMGDHPMFKAVPTLTKKQPKRSIYNVFLNLPENLKYDPNKQFTAVDLAPTFVDILGIKQPSHALGLGRSLFSDVPSLVSSKKLKFTTKIRQKSNLYRTFNTLKLPEQFTPYKLGTVLDSATITNYATDYETQLNHNYFDVLFLKLDKIPDKDLTLDITFNAMQASHPELVVTVNKTKLPPIKYEHSSNSKSVSITIPKEAITSNEVVLTFQNNNFRSFFSLCIEILKFSLT